MDEFTPLTLERDGFRVTMEHIGEGYNGEYDPEDEQDERLLRFYCDTVEPVTGAWVEVEDASYCTMLPIFTPPTTLCEFMLHILDVLKSGKDVRRRLEEATHLTMED